MGTMRLRKPLCFSFLILVSPYPHSRAEPETGSQRSYFASIPKKNHPALSEFSATLYSLEESRSKRLRHFTMSPEVANTGSKAPEQPEQTSSPAAHPSFHGPKTSSTLHQVPEDMAIALHKTQRMTLVDTVDAATADLLESAVEDGPGEDSDLAEKRVGSLL